MTEAQDELTQARERLAELETALTESTQAETDAETVIATKAEAETDAARNAAPYIRARDTANGEHWQAQNDLINAINNKAQATANRDGQQALVNDLVAAQ